jgi:outer membrane lipoprotein SlyB
VTPERELLYHPHEKSRPNREAIMSNHAVDLPVRVGVFSTVEAADRVVRRLLAAGFHKDHISVVTSDKSKEQQLQRVDAQPVPGENTPEAIVAGSFVGATVGGLMLAATAFVTGGVSLVAAGPVLAGGALVGSFAGAMMTRGFEKEAANYYDQAVQKGKILVSVEDHGGDKLAEAERIFAEAGAESVPLVEG